MEGRKTKEINILRDLDLFEVDIEGELKRGETDEDEARGQLAQIGRIRKRLLEPTPPQPEDK